LTTSEKDQFKALHAELARHGRAAVFAGQAVVIAETWFAVLDHGQGRQARPARR
jgi:hypothetical protein